MARPNDVMAFSMFMGEWRNRQTRRSQKPVPKGVEVQLLSRPFVLLQREELKGAPTFLINGAASE